MATWINPRDGDASAWSGKAQEDEESDRPSRAVPTLERAHRISLPFQFSESRTYYETLPDLEIEGVRYPSAEVKVVAGVTRDRTLKLHVRGLLWNPHVQGTNAFRFKSQVIREKPPTETVPFGEYRQWSRSQRGSVADDGVVPEFDPDVGTERTERIEQSFGDFFEPVRMPIAELELVRNPQFAAYVLRETDRWEAYGEVFRWHPDAFTRREMS